MVKCKENLYILKSKTPSKNSISVFRPIAVLNVEGKLFVSLISKWVVSHVVQNNKIINLSVQKACMEKVPGCYEHLSMVWTVLKEARAQKSLAASIWLDVAKAYGSIPHILIFFALWRYGIPNQWIQIVEPYYVGIFSKSLSESATSSWHRHQHGIFAGCTISFILFLAGMNVILEYSLHTNVPRFVIHNHCL